MGSSRLGPGPPACKSIMKSIHLKKSYIERHNRVMDLDYLDDYIITIDEPSDEELSIIKLGHYPEPCKHCKAINWIPYKKSQYNKKSQYTSS